MTWTEKDRMDGKGVYYESVTAAGRRAYVIQRDRDFHCGRRRLTRGLACPVWTCTWTLGAGRRTW